MTLIEMLEQRHTLFLEWSEPREARSADGVSLEAHLTCRATVHDCVNMARLARFQYDLASGPGMDEDLLNDFISVHWASVVPAHGSP